MFNVRVDPPGPKSKSLTEREKKSVSGAHYHYLPIAIKSGEGNTVQDVDGNTYLDFTAGAAVMGVGYRHPEVVQALNNQLGEMVAHSIFFATFEPLIQLAEKVQEMVPWEGLKDGKLAFGASGSEATEIALWLARESKRLAVIALFPSYHGRTLAANSLTAMRSSFRKNTVPLSSGIIHAPYPDTYRCPVGRDASDCGGASADYLEMLLDTVVPPEDVAAIIMEPIGGSGGYQVPPPEYIPRVKKICEKNNFLFIADEVQTGFGRSGKMFAMEHYGVEPDMMTIGKVLGGGLPIGALLARKEKMDSWAAGGWGATFGGNLLSATAGLATLEVIQREKLDQNAERKGEQIIGGLQELMENHQLVGDVRGKGLMIAFELVKDRKTKAPAAAEAKMVVERCMKKGLLVSTCGTYGNCVRLLPPLTISENEAGTAVDTIGQSLKDLD